MRNADMMWEPTPDGILINFGLTGGIKVEFPLAMTSVRELMRDMTEAHWLARGRRLNTPEAQDVLKGDLLLVGGSEFLVASVMMEGHIWSVLQSDEGAEVRFRSDDTVTVWRSIQ